MEKRNNIVFATAILVLALAFGVGASQWLEPGEGRAASPQQLTVANTINQEAADTLAQVEATQELLASLYEQLAPSVVNIQVTANAEGEGVVPAQGGVVQGQGSGWIYDESGLIVTNNHVIANAISITVYFSNGMWAPAELVATDPSADLAVIKVTPPEGVTLVALPLAEPNAVRVGFTVVALGSPFGLRETMTTGIVSAVGRSFPTDSGADGGSSYSLPDVIQTDTAINPGNSGGPLLNLQGQVIGVNFAINTTSGSNSGVGFAIPISVVQKIVPALINEGGYDYPYLGIAGTTISGDVAQQFDLPANQLGVYVAEVVEDGPAARAGVTEGDLIVGINDQAISQFEELISYLFNNTAAGDTVTLHLLRGGEETTADVVLEARPGPTVAQQGETPEMQVTISEAIRSATDAVRESGMMEEVDGANAQASVVDGRSVWIVTLTNQEQRATVIVDGTTGEVLNVDIG